MTMTLSRRGARQKTQALSATDSPLDFEALFQEHWERLVSMLGRLAGDPAEAEDLALEAFIQLYRRPPADPANLGGWLYRVASNLGLNALRAQKRRRFYEEQAGVVDINGRPGDDPAEAVEQAQERQRVRATLSAMKPRSAQVLLLRHSGLSYTEVAAVLDISPGSVGTLLARAEAEFEQLYNRS